MKPRLTNTLLIVLLIMNLAFIGTWWMHHKRGGHGRDMMEMHHSHGDKGMMFLSREIGFDSAQQNKAAKLFDAHAASMKKYQDEISRLQKQIYDCMAKDAPDSTNAFKYADTVGMYRVAMQKEFFRNSLSIRQMCTPEQKKKYYELMLRMTKHLGHHMN